LNNFLKRESTSTYFEHREKYIYLRYKDLSLVHLEEAKINAEILIELCDGKRLPFISDGLNMHARFSHKSREFYSTHEPLLNVRSAQALLVNNTSNRLLANFYIKFHTPPNPIKVFSKLKNAEDWVKQFIVD
jgi:hypothetical protein